MDRRRDLHRREVINTLIRKGFVNQEMIEKARLDTQRLGIELEQALEHLGYISEEKIVEVEAEVLQIPYVELAHYKVDPNIYKLIPAEFTRKHKVVPLFKVKDTVIIGMADPVNIVIIDKIRQLPNMELFEPVLVSEKGVLNLLASNYEIDESVEELIRDFAEQKDKDERDLIERAGDPPLIRLVNLVIKQSIKDKVSDIHVEPCKDTLRIRFRIDGVLFEALVLPQNIQSAFISRIKLMCNMDIAESRKPQDGRISMTIDETSIEMRVSAFPSLYGENVVMRLMDKSSGRLGLDGIGFEENDLKMFRTIIRQPNGIILVTGPTGSGKTSTLYSVLSEINSMEKNIITLEDPIEYELPIIRQTQINTKVGVTFANGLRSILRQDPDIIMVGEIRDKETAEVAIQAALTGHLVLSTLHTNDAPSATTRLIDMGIEPFLVASSLIGVLAQRLVRLICSNCKTPLDVEGDFLQENGLGQEDVIYEGKGCPECKKTGFSGRTAIFEFLPMNEDMRKMILSRQSGEMIKRKAISSGMKTLRDNGLNCVKKGLTTLDEVLIATKEETLAND